MTQTWVSSYHRAGSVNVPLAFNTTSPLTPATQNIFYGNPLAGTGGFPPYTWALISQTGTNGWIVSPGGTVAGTPINVETDQLTISLTDSSNTTIQGVFFLNVQPQPQAAFPTYTPPAGSYLSTQFVVIASTTPGSICWYTKDGSTPVVIGGVPQGTTTQYTTPVIVNVTEVLNAIATATGFANSNVASASYVIGSPLQITTTSPLPNANQGSAYTTTMSATGGSGTGYVWAITSQTGSNSWVINSSTGVISGTPSSIETDTLSIKVTDSLSNVAGPKNFSLQVFAASSFNFFVSPIGDDTTGNGTLANPWSITALNALGSSSKASQYSQKRIGLIGDVGATLSGFQWTGAAGQFSCSAATLTVGMYCMITGTAGGTGSLAGYASGNVYYISATNGSTTGTLTTKGGSMAQALVTTAGTPTGLTFLLNQPFTYGQVNGAKTTLYALCNAAGNQAAIAVNGGNASNNTYLASCNSAGVYTPRWAVIDASNGPGVYSSNGNSIVIGQTSESTPGTVANTGYVTFDGLTVRYFTFCGIMMGNPGGSVMNNVIIQNCELYFGGGNPLISSTSNPGAIRYWNVSQILITNNKIYDLQTSDQWAFNAIMCYGNAPAGSQIYAATVTNNTTYNCSAVLQKDQTSDFANCSYNYFDHGQFGSAANGAGSNVGTGSLNTQQPQSGVTSNFHHNICLGELFLYPDSGTNWAIGTYNIYNNTIYGTPNYPGFVAIEAATGQGASPPIPPSGAAAVQFQHNLVYAATSFGTGGNNSGSVYIKNLNIANATFNNNVYGSGCSFSKTYNTSTNLATWKTNSGCDQNSVSISSTPFISTPQALVPASFAVNANAVIGGVTCGALDGSGPIGCNFSNVQ